MPPGARADPSPSSTLGTASTAPPGAMLEEPVMQPEVPRAPTAPTSPQHWAGDDSFAALGVPTAIDTAATIEGEVAVEEIR